MPSVGPIYHKGVKLYYTDLSNATPEESIEVCKNSQKQIKAFQENSVLSLVNVEGIKFNSQVIQTVKETAKNNKPYIKSTVVYGIEGFTKILIKTVLAFSKREMKIFDDLEEAKDYLRAVYVKGEGKRIGLGKNTSSIIL